MDRKAIITNPCLAGAVKRYHTWPMLRTQSVAEHTWQCMRIYWQLFGPMAPEVSTYLLWHDAGEISCGDLPFPVKRNNPALKGEIDRLEHEAVEAMGGPRFLSLPSEEAVRVKAVDLLEMLETGLTEVRMGNSYAAPIVTVTRAAVLDLPLDKLDRAAVCLYIAGLETGGE